MSLDCVHKLVDLIAEVDRLEKAAAAAKQEGQRDFALMTALTTAKAAAAALEAQLLTKGEAGRVRFVSTTVIPYEVSLGNRAVLSMQDSEWLALQQLEKIAGHAGLRVELYSWIPRYRFEKILPSISAVYPIFDRPVSESWTKKEMRCGVDAPILDLVNEVRAAIRKDLA